MATVRWAALILLFAIICLPDSPAFGGMVPLLGSHWVVVWDTDGGDSDGLSDITLGVPLERTASANHRMLAADGVFSTLFDTSLLTSNFQSTHSVLQTMQELPSELFSETGSTFWFTTDMDVEVSVHGRMSFDLAADDSETGMVLEVFDGNQDSIYRNLLGSFVGAGSDMFLFDDSIVLDGGGTYFVVVSSALVGFAHRQPNPLLTASGEIALRIATVPEPASFVLLCCGALLAGVSWRRQSSGHSRSH